MKNRPSKLDAHAERLEEWFTPIEQGGKGLTIAQAQEQLKMDGVTVSAGRLSEWWRSRLEQRQQERLLGNIVSGSRACQEVEASFALNPAPGLEALASLHRLLAFQLAAKGTADPELLELSTKCTKVVLDYGKLRAKQQDQALSRDKFEFDAAKACLAKLPELKAVAADKGLTQEQQVEQIRLKLFGALAGQAIGGEAETSNSKIQTSKG